MKFIFASLILATMSLLALAQNIPPQTCKGSTKTHIVALEQVGTDIHASLEDKNLHKYRDITVPNEGKFKLSGKEKSIMLLHDMKIPDFLKTRYLSREFFVAMMLGRPEFRGEEDLLYSFADELVGSLVCR